MKPNIKDYDYTVISISNNTGYLPHWRHYRQLYSQQVQRNIMNKTLFDIYNSLKASFVKAMEPYLVEQHVVTFSPPLHINLPNDNDESFEEITSIEYDEKEQTWYVHNYITSLDLMTNEYWTPLRDMSFDELFKISERL